MLRRRGRPLNHSARNSSGVKASSLDQMHLRRCRKRRSPGTRDNSSRLR
jgi:hypothetical protein